MRTGDIQAYRRVLGEEISNLPFVASTSTFVAMETVRESGRAAMMQSKATRGSG